VKKIAEFLQVAAERGLLQTITDKCSFNSMSNSDKFGCHWKRISNDNNVPICRKGNLFSFELLFCVSGVKLLYLLFISKKKR